MRFIGRALSGLLLAAITVALIGAGLWRLQSAGSDAGGRGGQPARERTYNVDVATLESASITPVITAFGQVRAWRMLEIRAAVSGPIVAISPNFRSGATAAADELLFQVDPADYERRLGDAQVALAQAQADLTEARDTLPLAAAEVRTAQRQLRLRRSDLQRKSGLKGKGFVAQGSLDEARLAVASAQQALNSKNMARIAANARIRSRELAVQRAQIAVKNAQRALTDTSFRAPFIGPLTDVSANLGKRLSPNEKLGVLIDPASLEVSFTVNDAQFGRLLTGDGGGGLKPLPVTASLVLGSRRVALKGVLDRAESVTDLTSGGRTVFARLDPGQNAPIRPGDFVTVRVNEPELTNVASIPARAATNDGEILLLDDEDRLAVHQARIVRRQDEILIVADVPFGREYVSARQPFLDAGIKVKALRQGAKPKPTHMALSDERRQRLRKAIASAKRIPPDIRERLLKTLERPKVPIRLVERVEARMKEAAQRNGAAQ